MKNETKFKIKVQSILKTIPNLWFSKIQSVALRALPDIIICYKGKFYSYELKVVGGKIDPLQEYVKDKINASGGTARIVDPTNYKQFLKEDFGWEE